MWHETEQLAWVEEMLTIGHFFFLLKDATSDYGTMSRLDQVGSWTDKHLALLFFFANIVELQTWESVIYGRTSK